MESWNQHLLQHEQEHHVLVQAKEAQLTYTQEDLMLNDYQDFLKENDIPVDDWIQDQEKQLQLQVISLI